MSLIFSLFNSMLVVVAFSSDVHVRKHIRKTGVRALYFVQRVHRANLILYIEIHVFPYYAIATVIII